MTTAELLRRVRWGNVAKLLLPVAAVALIALWPRMRSEPPALPAAGARPVVAQRVAPAVAPRRVRRIRGHAPRRVRRRQAHAPRHRRAPRRRVRRVAAPAPVAPVGAVAPRAAIAPRAAVVASPADPAAEEFGAP